MPDEITPLTGTQKRDYMDAPSRCPRCHSEDIVGDSVTIDDGGAWQEVGCNECGAEWHDIYKLVDIEMRN